MSKLELFFVMELAGLAGMFMHFLKLQIKGQTPHDIITYFKNNFRDTIVAAGSATVGIVGAWATMDPANPVAAVVAAIPIGFAFDSVFNTKDRI